MPLKTADNNFGTAKWIVSATYSDGCTHTTIASALTSASSGDTIFIRPGIYVENLTLKAGVNLVAYSDAYTPNVTIVGKISYSSAGSVTISGIRLKTNADNFLAVTGSAASIVTLNECFFEVVDATGISFTSSSSSSMIRCTSCYGDITGASRAFFASSSAGTFVWDYSSLDSSGGAGTASTISAGTLNIHFSKFNNIVTTSGTATGVVRHSRMLTTNSTCLTIGGSGSFICTQSFFQAGTASAISISSSCTIENCVISSSNTNAVTGAGSVTYNAVSFSTSQVINTTTKSGGTLTGIQGGAAPAAGFLGEQIRSAVTSSSMSNGTPKNLTSISLTSGVWDVSANSYCIFSGNCTAYKIGISPTSATFLAADGDSQNITGAVSGANVVFGCAVPSYRVTLTSTTTYYLVAQANFSTGTGSADGRISATRVG